MALLFQKSWSMSFVLRHMRYMSMASALRYRNYTMRRAANKVLPTQLLRLRMHRPFEGDIWLREVGSDSTTFLEVVVLQVYGVITERLKTCQYVIDLGANIGLASRYFACAYPQCRVFAVEPD